MDDETKQFYTELFKDLPRCGPGSAEATRKAYSYLKDIPENPRILDIGVGTGMSTIELAKISQGDIMAIDVIEEYLEVLNSKLSEEQLKGNLKTHIMSMDAIEFEENSFDIIWSEGSIFVIGFQTGLKTWRKFLKKGGYLVVSDMVWYDDIGPMEVINYWERNYPAMENQKELPPIIQKLGYKLIGSFKLKEKKDWWQNLYEPLAVQVKKLQKKYKDNPLFAEQLKETELEMEYFRKYSNFYGYMFFVMKKI